MCGGRVQRDSFSLETSSTRCRIQPWTMVGLYARQQLFIMSDVRTWQMGALIWSSTICISRYSPICHRHLESNCWCKGAITCTCAQPSHCSDRRQDEVLHRRATAQHQYKDAVWKPQARTWRVWSCYSCQSDREKHNIRAKLDRGQNLIMASMGDEGVRTAERIFHDRRQCRTQISDQREYATLTLETWCARNLLCRYLDIKSAVGMVAQELYQVTCIHGTYIAAHQRESQAWWYSMPARRRPQRDIEAA